MSGCVLFIPKEEQDRRVAATPKTVASYIAKKLSVIVEKGAGVQAGFSDQSYADAGATIASRSDMKKADLIISVNPPSTIAGAKDGSWWISQFAPSTDQDVLKKMVLKKMTCFSLMLLPRISRAQSMDVLTSQTNLAGYKAVLLAAAELPKAFPMMMTAAGTIQPAKVVVLGAGVAGLSAIATAKRLGAVVYASDVRPAAKEQVESLGGHFIDVPFDAESEDDKGYAKTVSKEYLKRQSEEVARHLKTADVAITTALIPGRKAPVLITADMLKTMPNQSVVVDMASSQGGNCEGSVNNKTVVSHGVTIIGSSSIASQVATDASSVYAQNMASFVEGLTQQTGLSIPSDDEVYTDTLLMNDGKVVHALAKDALGDAS